MNGHVHQVKEEHPQVPSQVPSHVQEEQVAKDRGHDSNYPKGDTDRDDPGLLPGSDPDDDQDLGSGESDGDWSQDDMDAEIRRVKVRYF